MLDNLDRLAIDSAFKRRLLLSRTTSAVRGASLSEPERLAIIGQIATRGHEYVGQELVSLFNDAGVGRSRPGTAADDAGVLAATLDGGYVVMPGGLTRISASRDARAIALHRGDGTKDAWVLSDEPVTAASRCCDPRSVMSGRSGPARICRAARPTICSGLAVTRSVAEDIMFCAASSGG